MRIFIQRASKADPQGLGAVVPDWPLVVYKTEDPDKPVPDGFEEIAEADLQAIRDQYHDQAQAYYNQIKPQAPQEIPEGIRAPRIEGTDPLSFILVDSQGRKWAQSLADDGTPIFVQISASPEIDEERKKVALEKAKSKRRAAKEKIKTGKQPKGSGKPSLDDLLARIEALEEFVDSLTVTLDEV